MNTDGDHRTDRYVMTRTNFGGSELPDDEDRDGPRNFGLLAIQPPDAAASPRIFHWSMEPFRI
jgi:hypothetical protein